MLRRAMALLGMGFVLNVTGCAGLVEILMLPIKLLFELLGAAGSAVGLSHAVPMPEPAPLVQSAGPERWLVTGLRREEPCVITCAAPGFAPKSFRWPEDFSGRDEEVAVRLERE
jgi:hypothetical protein